MVNCYLKGLEDFLQIEVLSWSQVIELSLLIICLGFGVLVFSYNTLPERQIRGGYFSSSKYFYMLFYK